MNTVFSGELWIIYALVFGTILLGVQGLYVFFFKTRRENMAINRRLVLTAQLNNPAEVLEALRRERGFAFLTSNPLLQSLNDLVIQSGVRSSGTSFVAVIVTLGVVYFLVIRVLLGSIPLAFGFAILAAVGSFYLYLVAARARRMAAFNAQFPDALDVIVRGLRAGHPFRVALAFVARDMADPVGSEFGLVADEIMFGLEQSSAIENLNRRVGHSDLSFFATAITIQHQTGGNLAEILTRLSALLRSRSKLRLKIRALSSEGRLSAIVLSLAPFILFGIISFISPEYFMAVRDHPLIPPALALAFTMLAIGNFVMYRMVNFKF